MAPLRFAHYAVIEQQMKKEKSGSDSFYPTTKKETRYNIPFAQACCGPNTINIDNSFDTLKVKFQSRTVAVRFKERSWVVYQHRQCFRHAGRNMCWPKALHHYKKSMEIKKLFVSEAVSASLSLFHCAVGEIQSIILMYASLTDRNVLKMNRKIRGQ